eukprot:TRINITY_DN24919_c0_g1_i3.p1 TRINITY_DN24919_c0_g1~~TRINITY_DN24919_c0_g1_i3.p1  ORF type:complete len:348 (+),score=60.02 TRINITY_DN24919_c0_g1_i3:58-1044(+)
MAPANSAEDDLQPLPEPSRPAHGRSCDDEVRGNRRRPRPLSGERVVPNLRPRMLANEEASGSRSHFGQFIVSGQAPDGNCLFRSFSHQLYGAAEHHSMIRARCCEYMASERVYFEQFVAEPFDDYLSRLRKDGEWADDVEIEALSEIYDCRVEIYAAGKSSSSSSSPMRTLHETCDAKWPYPVRLQYEGRSHYNSLIPRTGFVPIALSLSDEPRLPGDIEDEAIAKLRKRQFACKRRKGALDLDVDNTDRVCLDQCVHLSRQEFEHKSAEEMDKALLESTREWTQTEDEEIDEGLVDAVLQQSMLEPRALSLSWVLVSCVAFVALPKD